MNSAQLDSAQLSSEKGSSPICPCPFSKDSIALLRPNAATTGTTATGADTATGDGIGRGAGRVAATGVDVGVGALEGVEALEDDCKSKGAGEGEGRRETEGVSDCDGARGMDVRRVGRAHSTPSEDDDLSVFGGVAVAVIPGERGGSSGSFLLPVGGRRGNTEESVGVLCPLEGRVWGWVEERKGGASGSVGEAVMDLEGFTSRDFVLIRAGPGPSRRLRLRV